MPSGIPDFRTPETGLWANVDPMEVAHIDVFERDPARFWSYYRPRFHVARRQAAEPRPRGAGRARAARPARGRDHPEHRPPAPRRPARENVVEVHGSIETSSCTRCGASFGLEEVDALFDERRRRRSARPAAGAVKPDVVLFGELLPESAMARAQRARRAGRADALRRLLARGLPGRRRCPQLTLERGGRLAIVTKGPTPYDGDAELKLDGEVDAELGALRRRAAPRAPSSLRT